jgi:hypothetical protein
MNLKDKILEYGIENCLFLVPMKPTRSILGFKFTSSDDSDIIVPCIITEERYKVADDFKIQLKCIYESFGKESFYTTDLKLLINSGRINFFKKGN